MLSKPSRSTFEIIATAKAESIGSDQPVLCSQHKPSRTDQGAEEHQDQIIQNKSISMLLWKKKHFWHDDTLVLPSLTVLHFFLIGWVSTLFCRLAILLAFCHFLGGGLLNFVFFQL